MKLTEMDKSMKSACFEEITHLICDADKKVNITDVSNNWTISHRDSETLLLEWIEKNKNKSLSKEFLIRGVEKNGNCVITVLAENKLDVAQKKFEKFCYSLYSVELASQSNANRLHVAKSSDCNKWINLPLKHVERDIVVKPLPIQQVEEPTKSKEPTTSKKNIQSMFSASKSTIKSEEKPSPEQVDESTKQKTPTTSKKNVQSMFSASKPVTKSEEKTSPEKDIKTEKETPKKQSPKKKEPVKTPKVASGKASIASFFSKPSSTGAHPKAKNVGVKKEIDPPVSKEELRANNSSNVFDDESVMDVDTPETPDNATDTKSKDHEKKKESTKKSNHKRSIIDVDEDECDDEIPCTPQESKKAKKSTKKFAEKSSKHSRIRKMEDSSDDEDNRNEQLKLLASPVKEKENKTPPKSEVVEETVKNGKWKGKRMVTRTFQDEDGYLVTKKEIEEYSEEESDNPLPPTEPVKAVEDVSTVDTTEKTKKKKISPPKPGSKQGSILSFFTKK